MSYWIWKDATGQWRWYLQAANGKKIAESGESYFNEADCDHGINLVKDPRTFRFTGSNGVGPAGTLARQSRRTP